MKDTRVRIVAAVIAVGALGGSVFVSHRQDGARNDATPAAVSTPKPSVTVAPTTTVTPTPSVTKSQSYQAETPKATTSAK